MKIILALFFLCSIILFFVFLSDFTIKKDFTMKRHFYAVMLLLGLSITVISCGGRNNSSDDSTTVTETIDTIEETLTNTLPDNPDIPTVEAASVDNMKMVLDNQGNLVGRYIGSNENTYTVNVQEDFVVPKEGHMVVVFSAANKQGVVYTRRTHVNIRKSPSLNAPIVTQISYEKGSVPETYPCIGKVDEWYKIRVKDKVGYVRHDLVEWDGMDSF